MDAPYYCITNCIFLLCFNGVHPWHSLIIFLPVYETVLNEPAVITENTVDVRLVGDCFIYRNIFMCIACESKMATMAAYRDVVAPHQDWPVSTIISIV